MEQRRFSIRARDLAFADDSGSEMGIRFYCPNGHRLHVKTFLAGKRGICPHCATRFRIPRESEIPRGSPKIRPNSVAATSAAAGNGKHQAASAAISPGKSELLAPIGAGQAGLPEQPGFSVPPGSAGQSSFPIDPITEAPDAVWYVRPPSGGQYGPAKGDVMQRWIAEGRVSSDSLVWREGWPDWLTAGPIFPALNSTYTAPAPTKPKRESVSLQLQPAAADPPAGMRPAAVAARPQSKSLAAVVILGLIAVVLVAALVIVLTNRS